MTRAEDLSGAVLAVAFADISVHAEKDAIRLHADRFTFSMPTATARGVALSILALTDEGNSNG